MIQQLREAFSYDSAPRHLIFDGGGSFNDLAVEILASFADGFPPLFNAAVASA